MTYKIRLSIQSGFLEQPVSAVVMISNVSCHSQECSVLKKKTYIVMLPFLNWPHLLLVAGSFLLLQFLGCVMFSPT